MKRLLMLLKRKMNARKIKINFPRASKFSIPDRITINKHETNISFLNEHGSRVAFIEIFLDDIYNIKKIRKKNIETILDIGAHSGFFSLHCRNNFPLSNIHAYEPNPLLSSVITKNLLSQRIEVFFEAVGNVKGKVEIVAGTDSVLSKTKLSPKGNVKLIPFQQCINRLGGRIDLLKFDCEGCEWDITKDFKSLKNVRYLTMEYHLFISKQKKLMLMNFLQNSKFKLIKHYEIDHFEYGAKTGIIFAKNLAL